MMDFNEVFGSFKPIKFDTKWCNGTGYLDFATKGKHAPLLCEGEVRTFVDNKARKGFIIGTLRGNVVVFQRYSEGQRGIWVANTTRTLWEFLGPDYMSAFDEQAALKLVGVYPEMGINNNLNVGNRLSDFLNTL